MTIEEIAREAADHVAHLGATGYEQKFELIREAIQSAIAPLQAELKQLKRPSATLPELAKVSAEKIALDDKWYVDQKDFLAAAEKTISTTFQPMAQELEKVRRVLNRKSERLEKANAEARQLPFKEAAIGDLSEAVELMAQELEQAKELIKTLIAPGASVVPEIANLQTRLATAEAELQKTSGTKPSFRNTKGT